VSPPNPFTEPLTYNPTRIWFSAPTAFPKTYVAHVVKADRYECMSVEQFASRIPDLVDDNDPYLCTDVLLRLVAIHTESIGDRSVSLYNVDSSYFGKHRRPEWPIR